MKCTALQEIRWQDTGTTKLFRTNIFNGKSERPRCLGTSFAVHEIIIHTIKEFTDVNLRISILPLNKKNLIWF